MPGSEDRNINVAETASEEQKRTDAAIVAEEKEAKPIAQETVEMRPVSEPFTFDTFWEARNISFAQTADGKRLESKEEIQEALSQKDGRLLVHTKGGRVFAAMNQDGELRTTKSIIPGKDAEMQVSKNRTAETTTILQWNEADITNAVSASGKTLEGPEEIRKALDEKQQVFLYTKDEPEYPHVVEKRGEEYAVSKYGQEVDMQWGGTSLLYAKDVDGNEFRSPEAIQSALESGNGRLLVHLKDDPDDAYMLQKREDGVYLSNDPVKSGNAMNKDAYKKLDGEPAMVSKKSLSEDDFLPAGTSLSETKLLSWKKEDVLHAISSDGKTITEYPQIVDALGKGDTRILLYTKADPEPFLVERKKDRFYTSTNTMGKLERLMQEAKTTDLSTLDPEMFTSEEKKLSTVKRSFDNFTKGMDEVLFAIDDQGKIYGKEGKTEEIHSELSKEGRRLFVFEKDGMSGQVTAKAMENRNGELFVSNGPVDGRHKMQDTPAFAPKASVKVDDIIKAVDPTEHERRLDDVDASKRKMDALKLNMDALDKAAETRKNLKAPSKPVKPKKPGKPQLGFWGKVWRGFTKVFTFGLGETKAYKNLPEKRRRYEEIDLPAYEKKLKAFPEQMKRYEAALQSYKDKDAALKYQIDHKAELQQKYQKEFREAQKDMAAAGSRARIAENQMREAEAGNTARDAKAYRDHLEVRVEGIADLMEKGKITPDNIFAYTWMQESACKGKSAADPEARKAAAAFLASNTIQTRVLADKATGKVNSRALEERSVDTLNSGDPQRMIEQDEVFTKMMDDMKGAAIDPEKLVGKYMLLSNRRDKEKQLPANLLKEAKADMIRGFGEQEISDRAIDEVIRMRKLDEGIDKFEKQGHNLSRMGDKEFAGAKKSGKDFMKQAFEMKPTEEDRRPYKEAAAKLGKKGPMKLDEMSKALDSQMPKMQMKAPETGKGAVKK